MSIHSVDAIRTSEHVPTEITVCACAHVNLSTALSVHVFSNNRPHLLYYNVYAISLRMKEEFIISIFNRTENIRAFYPHAYLTINRKGVVFNSKSWGATPPAYKHTHTPHKRVPQRSQERMNMFQSAFHLTASPAGYTVCTCILASLSPGTRVGHPNSDETVYV
jgi:hypothetical protein